VLNFGTEVEIKGNKMSISMISTNLDAKTPHTANQTYYTDSISFITRSDQEEDKVEITADLKPDTWDSYNGQIQWKVEDNLNSADPVINPPSNGDNVSFYAVRPSNITIERQGPMSYKVTASLTMGNVTGEEYINVTQHNLDDLRQEYLDREIIFREQMGNEKFDQTMPIMYPNLVNKAGSGVDKRHDWWIVAQLYNNAYDLDKAYPGMLSVTSGFRCPYGNARVGGEPDSNHMRGKALDFQQGNIDGQARSLENWKVAVAAWELHHRQNNPLIAQEILLWNGIKYQNCLDNINNCPEPDDNQPNYIRGHVAW
jgi:uncharacterized protein YcbK (DUF882 family)